MSTWRQRAEPIIRKAVCEIVGPNPPPYSDYEKGEIRRLLRRRYPWGKKDLWPFKVWCDEIARQLGEKTEEREPPEVDPRQIDMFGKQEAE